MVLSSLRLDALAKGLELLETDSARFDTAPNLQNASRSDARACHFPPLFPQ